MLFVQVSGLVPIAILWIKKQERATWLMPVEFIAFPL